ncbi:hypothetical protein NPIL_134051 [Nephila pilipes]|uniref:Peptidase A2 domain-containing protein n=1 Tax=Nephila pilipes TaxID=299642 RepID=A0A8X6TGH1_NEPPI|nr:hypothetical protein NPIL_134051 [Nephila pilipes]
MESVKLSNSEKHICFIVPQKGLHLRDIRNGNDEKTISFFTDTGCSVSLIHEDASTKIADKQKFSKKCNFLSGIGKSQVLTKGSFEHDFAKDDFRQVNQAIKFLSQQWYRYFGTSFFKVHPK